MIEVHETESDVISNTESEVNLISEKKRGRKKENDQDYFERAMAKIEEIKDKLKTAKQDGIDVKERQKMRNQVSAQQSRIKKKQEVLYLSRMLDESKSKYE